jgi:hypothetical protein
MNLDHALKEAMERKQPDPGFANRVMAAIRESENGKRKTENRTWRALAAGVVLTAILGGWAAHQAAERRAEGEKAREEVLLALRITSQKLRTAQDHVRDIK